MSLLDDELALRPGSEVEIVSFEAIRKLDLEKQTSVAVAEVIEGVTSSTQAAVLGFATSNYLMSIVFSNLI